VSDTKICPYCQEEIKASAIKCKHCGERLDGAPARTEVDPRPPSGTQRGAAAHASGPVAAAPPKLGSFILGELLGRGAMGIVYRGRHERLGNPVAIKVLPANLTGDPDLMARFEQEARVQANLRHPNIVGVHDFISEGDTFAFVMELVEGRTLESVIAEAAGPLPLPRCMQLFVPVLNALGYAHEQGVVHRDVKPSNIMVAKLGDQEVVKVADFGIAKAMSSARRTATGAMMGTLLYMSPEQLRGEKDVDARADIYSLGVMLYEMVTGRVPFASETEYGLITAHLTQAPAPPTTLARDLPPALERVILKAMAKDRAERFATTKEFRAALSGIGAGVTQVIERTSAGGVVEPGTRLGPYVVGAVLGRGGMGTVHRGEHERLKQAVAIKVLPPKLAGDAALMGRFEQEARLQAKLRHPNIVGVHDFLIEGDIHAFVMELVEGTTLEELLRDHGALGPARCAAIFGPVLDAMRYAHAQGVVHRDLKPSNIMIGTAGGTEVVKVSDFGIAKAYGAERRTATGMVLGTTRYMSPEQCRGAKDIDHRSDIYSLGVTLYEAVAGRYPFPGHADYEFMTAHLTAEPTPPRGVQPGLPPALEQVILRAMAKDPAARFQSTGEMKAALEAAVAGAGASWQPAPVAAPAAPRETALPATVAVAAPEVLAPPALRAAPTAVAVTAPPASRAPLVLGLAGLLVVGGGLGVYFGVIRRPGPPPAAPAAVEKPAVPAPTPAAAAAVAPAPARLGLVCPKCGAVSPAAAKHCGKCGQSLATTVAQPLQACGGCGADYPVAAKFCPKCGRPSAR
jgi:serine/threonine-protein kinase